MRSAPSVATSVSSSRNVKQRSRLSTFVCSRSNLSSSKYFATIWAVARSRGVLGSRCHSTVAEKQAAPAVDRFEYQLFGSDQLKSFCDSFHGVSIDCGSVISSVSYHATLVTSASDKKGTFYDNSRRAEDRSPGHAYPSHYPEIFRGRNPEDVRRFQDLAEWHER